MLKQNVAGRVNTKMLTKVGLLSAITVIMGSTGLGFVQLPMLKLTIMHVPVIIGAILEGPMVGALIGLMFGLFSVYQNLSAPNFLSFAFYNPLVSVMPRILIGITAYYVYKLIARYKESIGIAVGAAIGSFTNTVGVLGMIYILYLQEYAKAKELNIGAAVKALLTAGGTNGVLEAILAAVITVPIVLAVNKIKKR